MLCEHKSILKLSEYDNSQWITFAVVNLLLILFVKLGMPLIKSFMRETRLLDEEIARQFREFYYAKFGPHFLARNSSPETVVGVFIYLGLSARWLLECSFLSNVSFLLATLTLAMWKIELCLQLFTRLRRFIRQNGFSGPDVDKITGMPSFQPDLMEYAMSRLYENQGQNEKSKRESGPWERFPASTESPDYTPGSSTRVRQ